jgi:hypothetical protein
LDFDGQRFWTLSEDPPEQWLPLPQQQQQQQGQDHHHDRHRQQQQHMSGSQQLQNQQKSGFQQNHHHHHQQQQQQQVVLPSDSQHRPDLVALRAGDVKGAQQLKEQMEQQQRRDAKARPAFAHLDYAHSS